MTGRTGKSRFRNQCMLDFTKARMYQQRVVSMLRWKLEHMNAQMKIHEYTRRRKWNGTDSHLRKTRKEGTGRQAIPR